MATAAEVQALLPQMVEVIVRQFKPVRVIHFGSHARGDAHEGSDVDLLVSLPDEQYTPGTGLEFTSLSRSFPSPRTSLPYAGHTGTAITGLWAPWLLPAAEEGIFLYDTQRA